MPNPNNTTTHDLLQVLYNETDNLTCYESAIGGTELPVVLQILTDDGLHEIHVDQIRIEPVSKPCPTCKHNPKTKGLVLHASL